MFAQFVENINNEQSEMINWFEIFADRLTAIEEGQVEIRNLLNQAPKNMYDNLFGNFEWLEETYCGIPSNTLRVNSSNGKIPGLIKEGKRVLYDKETVVKNLRSKVLMFNHDTGEFERIANEEIRKKAMKSAGL